MILAESVRSSAFSLAYNGDFQSAINLLGEHWRGPGLEPQRNGESDVEYAELLLVCGFLTAETGRVGIHRSQAAAKDLLSASERFFGDDMRRHEARLWLALSYYWCGENNEALTLLESILNEHMADSFVTFTAGHVRGLVLLALGQLAESNAAFESVEVFLDTVTPLPQAKFYLNRGMLRRSQGRYEDALQDYERAGEAARRAGSVRFEAAALNNAVRVYEIQGELDKARSVAQRALLKFFEAGDRLHEAKVLDEIARIFLREDNFGAADRYATSAIAILSRSDHEAWLAEALITQGIARACLGMARARASLNQALEICNRQGGSEQAGIAIEEMWTIVQHGKESSARFSEAVKSIEHDVYAELLAKHDGKISAAADELGCHHHVLQKRIRRFPDLAAKRRHRKSRRKSLIARQ